MDVCVLGRRAIVQFSLWFGCGRLWFFPTPRHKAASTQVFHLLGFRVFRCWATRPAGWVFNPFLLF